MWPYITTAMERSVLLYDSLLQDQTGVLLLNGSNRHFAELLPIKFCFLSVLFVVQVLTFLTMLIQKNQHNRPSSIVRFEILSRRQILGAWGKTAFPFSCFSRSSYAKFFFPLHLFIFSSPFFPLQQIAFKNLVQRNRQGEQQANRPPPANSIIHLPFIIVNTSKKTVIDCSISSDKYMIVFLSEPVGLYF